MPVQLDELTIHQTPSHVLLETPSMLVRFGGQTAEVCLPQVAHTTTNLCGICGSLGGPEEPPAPAEQKYRLTYEHDEL